MLCQRHLFAPKAVLIIICLFFIFFLREWVVVERLSSSTVLDITRDNVNDRTIANIRAFRSAHDSSQSKQLVDLNAPDNSLILVLPAVATSDTPPSYAVSKSEIIISQRAADNNSANPHAIVLPSALTHLPHIITNTTSQRKTDDGGSSTINVSTSSISALIPRLLIPSNAQSFWPTAITGAINKTERLIIGIPTVKRHEGHDYLRGTLNSLFQNLAANDTSVTLVVFIAEISDLTWADNLSRRLASDYAQQISRGLLHILCPSPLFYPNFSSLPLTLSDNAERVRWRSKQSLDFAYLMAYAQPLGTYYLQLEDDVITKPKYAETIRTAAAREQQSNPQWFMLEFSSLGFIGKMFRTRDLPLLTEFFIMFYFSKPVDFLIADVLRVRACGLVAEKQCDTDVQKTIVRHKPSLFQHVGVFSSLAGKKQLLKDKDFGPNKNGNNIAVAGSAKIELTNNPKLVLCNTTLKAYDEKYTLEKIYVGKDYFWAYNPQPNDVIYFGFEKPTNVTRILVESGNAEHPDDRFYDAVVEVLYFKPGDDSENHSRTNLSALTANKGDYDFVKVAEFDRFTGTAEAKFASDAAPVDVVRIRNTKASAFWLLIRRILVEERRPSK